MRIKVGPVEVTCGEDISAESLANVLEAVRQRLGDLIAADPAEPISLARMLRESHAQTFGEKAGVVAYWLEESQGRPDWRSGDVVQALEDASETVPANITDALNQKLKKGLFEVRDRRWKLTGEGRGWVKYSLLNHRDQAVSDPALG